MADKEIEPLLRALIPIKDYLTDPDIVISGGWVPTIYRRYVMPGKGQPSLRTIDVDILFKGPLLVNINEKIDGELVNLKLFAPQPAAFVFQKSLAFTKRKDRIKKAKDLYYVFDVIAGYPEFAEELEQGIAKLRYEHPSWFRQFIKNLTQYFLVDGAPGPRLVVEQRLRAAYSGLNDQQLARYCRSMIGDFVTRVSRNDSR